MNVQVQQRGFFIFNVSVFFIISSPIILLINFVTNVLSITLLIKDYYSPCIISKMNSELIILRKNAVSLTL